MGLSIHYSGTIKDKTLIPQLVEEVQDVCTILDWRWHLTKDENIDGISFTPPECETLSLTFLPTGEAVSAILLKYGIHPATTISVKTQYAGIDVHIAVIKLLKHLSQRYFSHFELSDEGGYWETDDEEVLRKKFGQYNAILNAVQSLMKDFKGLPDDTPQTLADRLEKFLKDRLDKENQA